ncbi:UPF0182 family protein [Synechocystis sp. LKSZ1]|uniref:UPF0182 family protein n=1 Tax=Synechocystis sp. LKSZ1 TaxID=3144951 RepID=UPI00336BD31D
MNTQPLPWRFLLAFLAGVLGIELVAHFYIEMLWFQELGYLQVFFTRLRWEFLLATAGTLLSLAFLGWHYRQARGLAWPAVISSNRRLTSRYLPQPPPLDSTPPRTAPLGLAWLLPLIIGIELLLAALVIYYGKTALTAWTLDFNLPEIIPAVPKPFQVKVLWEWFYDLPSNLLSGLILLGIVGLTWWRRTWALPTLITILSLMGGGILAGNWTHIVQFLHYQNFPAQDPQFGRNIGFYIFYLPVWQLLETWLRGLFLFAFLVTVLTYLQSANSLSEGKFPGFSRPQLRHLCRLGALVALILSLGHGLRRYQYLYTVHPVVYGANYSDIHIRLPLETALVLLSLTMALWLGWLGKWGWSRSPKLRSPSHWVPLRFSVWPFLLYLFLLVTQLLLAQGVELLNVQPNQLDRERPYLARSIAATRAAFGLDTIQSLTLSGTGPLSYQDLLNNHLTLDNIRLWDPIPLLKTNRQLQQIRLYYKFPDADLDRYTIRVQSTEQPDQITTAKQQVLIASRELDYNAVPAEAKTWVNEHLVYTHGYGFTLSPVNLVDQGGLPFYFVKDIGTETQQDALRTSSELIRSSIPISKPRIYFGELTDTYVMTSTKVREFDFPSGQDNVYNIYDGKGGVRLGGYLRHGLFAWYLRDWKIIFTRNFTPDTQVLFRRNINRRIRELAPFLHFDRNPYLVTAKAHPRDDTSLYWVVDAYTTSHYYPYADPGERNFNYIRNSVKIVIDAYNGDVRFYAMDPSDPILRSWQGVFPGLFQPLAAMPKTLRSHIRYPVDLFSTQSERLLTYHMTDIDVFYNREDQWQIPREIYGSEPTPVSPYYLIMKLTGINNQEEEFVLSQVYTPISRNNLNALLFARSDEQNYGKLLLYTLPKERLVYGPEQIEALINQDPVISERISLWSRDGSRVIQGNLLVIPIEESLLYVEPIYLEAEKNSLPTLARVIVVYGNQIAMAETLNQALAAIFETPANPFPAIVRPVQADVTENK